MSRSELEQFKSDRSADFRTDWNDFSMPPVSDSDKKTYWHKQKEPKQTDNLDPEADRANIDFNDSQVFFKSGAPAAEAEKSESDEVKKNEKNEEQKTDPAASDKTLDQSLKIKVQLAEAEILRHVRQSSVTPRDALEVAWQDRVIKLIQRMPDKELELKLTATGRAEIAKPADFIRALKRETIESLGDRFVAGKVSRLALDIALNWFNERQLMDHKALIKRSMELPVGGPFAAISSPSDTPNPYKDDFDGFKKRIENLKASELKQLDKEASYLVHASDKPTLADLYQLDDNIRYFGKIHRLNMQAELKEAANQIHLEFKEHGRVDMPGWQPPNDPTQLADYIVRVKPVIETIKLLREMKEVAEQLAKLKGEVRERNLSAALFGTAFDHIEAISGALKKNQPNDFSKSLPAGADLGSSLESFIKRTLPPEWQNSGLESNLALNKPLDKHLEFVSQAANDYARGQFIQYYNRKEKGTVVFADDSKRIALAVLDSKGEIDSFYRERVKGGITTNERICRGIDGKTYYNPDGDRVDPPFPKERALINKQENFRQGFNSIEYGSEAKPGKDENEGKIFVKLTKKYLLDSDYTKIADLENPLEQDIFELSETRTYAPDELATVHLKDEENPEQVRADRLPGLLCDKKNWERIKGYANIGMNLVMLVSGGITIKAALTVGSRRMLAIGAAEATAGAVQFLPQEIESMGTGGKVLQKGSHYFIMLRIANGLGAGKVVDAPFKAVFGKSVLKSESAAAVQKAIEGSKWMSQVQQALHYTNQPLNVFLAYTLGRPEIEKIVGKEQYQNPDDFLGGLGKNSGEKSLTRSVSITDRQNAIAANQKLLSSLDASKDMKAMEHLERVKSIIGSPKTHDDYAAVELGKYFLPSADQLLTSKKQNKHYLPKYLNGMVESEGTPAERVAAAVSLLYLSMDSSGRTPTDAILLKRLIELPSYDRNENQPLNYPLPVGPFGVMPMPLLPDRTGRQIVNQEITVPDVVKLLRKEAVSSDQPEVRIMAADALFQVGALSSGDYAALTLDVLRNLETTPENKQFKLKLLRQFSDVLVLRTNEVFGNGMPASEWNKVGSSTGGNFPRNLHKGLLDLANRDRNPDIRAMAVVISNAHREREDVGKAVDRQFLLYEELKSKPSAKEGDFNDAVLAALKRDVRLNEKLTVDGVIPKSEDREQAIQSALLAIKSLRALDPKVWMTDTTKSQIDETLSFALLQCTDHELSPMVLVDVIDTWLEGDSHSAKLRTQVQESALKVLSSAPRNVLSSTPSSDPQYKESVLKHLQTPPAILRLIDKIDSIFADDKGRDSCRSALTNLISQEQNKSGWGQYPDLLVGCINGLSKLHATDGNTIDAISRYLLHDSGKTGVDSLSTSNPSVRLAAARAIYNLAGHRFVSNDKDEKQLKTALGPNAPAIRVDELLKRENDPMVLKVLDSAMRQCRRLDPTSYEYKVLFNAEIKRFREAQLATVTGEGAKDIIKKHPRLALLDPDQFKGAIKWQSDLNYRDPYKGTIGDLREFFQDDDTIHAVKESARKTATEEATQKIGNARDKAFSDIKNVVDADALLVLKHIITGTVNGLYTENENQREEAKKKASKTLLELCSDSDRVKNKELLAVVVTKCIDDLPWDSDPLVKLNLYACVNRLANQSDEKTSVLSPPAASGLLMDALKRVRGSVYTHDVDWKHKVDSKRLQIFLIQSLKNLRAQDDGNLVVLDHLSHDKDAKENLPEVAKFANDVLGEMRHGVAILFNDTPEDRSSSKPARAENIRSALKLERFYHEDACKAIFQACKGVPITDPGDARVEALNEALKHRNERVRLAAAMMLVDCKDSNLFISACDVLTDLAVSVTEDRYHLSAAKLLEDIITKGQKVDKQLVFKQWQRAYTNTIEQLKSENHDGNATRQLSNGNKVKVSELIAKLESVNPAKIVDAYDRAAKEPPAKLVKFVEKPVKFDNRELLVMARFSMQAQSCHNREVATPIDLKPTFRLEMPVKVDPLAWLDIIPPVELPKPAQSRLTLSKEEQDELAVSLLIRRHEQLLSIGTTGAEQEKRDLSVKTIDALRISKEIVPLGAAQKLDGVSDPRIGVIANLASEDITPDVTIEAASMILASGEKRAVLDKNTAAIKSPFSKAHVALAEQQLAKNATTLLHRTGLGDVNALALLDRAMQAQKSRNDSEGQKLYAHTLTTVSDYVMQRKPNWRLVEEKLKSYAEGKLEHRLPDGTIREIQIERGGLTFVDVDPKTELVKKVVTPGDEPYAEILARKLAGSLNPDDRLFIATRMLQTKIDIGFEPRHREAAIESCLRLLHRKEYEHVEGRTITSEVRYQAAHTILSLKLADTARNRSAIECLVELATGDSRARKDLRALEGEPFRQALSIAKIRACNCDMKIAADEQLRRAQVFLALAERRKNSVYVEADVYDLLSRSLNAKNVDISTLAKSFLDRSKADHGLADLPKEGKDPRIIPMYDALNSSPDKTDPLIIQAASSILRCNNVEDRRAFSVREILQRHLNERIDEIRVLEQEKSGQSADILKNWESIDCMLAGLGHNESEFSRLYIKSKRLEGKSDGTGLEKVYAELSEQLEKRGSSTGAQLYRAKLQDLQRMKLVEDVARVVSEEVAGAKPVNGAIARTDFDRLSRTEKQLSESLALIEKRVGADSISMAETYLDLAEFHQRAGNFDRALEWYNKADGIFSRQILDSTLGSNKVDQPAGSKDKLVDSTNERSPDFEPINDSDFRNLIDYQVSKVAVIDTANSRARVLSDRLIERSKSIFGDNAPGLMQAYLIKGESLSATGSNAEAYEAYKLACKTIESDLTPMNINSFSQIRQKMVVSLLKCQKSKEACMLIDETINKLCDKMPPEMVRTLVGVEMQAFAGLLERNSGNIDGARTLRARGKKLAETGVLIDEKTPFMGDHYHQFPR